MASFLLFPLHLRPLPHSGGGLFSPAIPILTLCRIQKNHNLLYKYPIIACASTSSSSWEREEIRWLREEQRWLREEQRWLREESRWNSERESLLQEIASLKLRIEALERENSSSGYSISDAIATLAPMLEAFKEVDTQPGMNQIADTGSGTLPIMLEEAGVKSEVKEMVLEEVKISESLGEEKKETTIRRTLRIGSEGEDVRVMQESLQRLGFYSGEEDMEYSSFSTGTERAVKTWQASSGASEDGIMTSDLLERLLMQVEMVDTGKKATAEQKGNSSPGQDVINGVPVSALTEITEIMETVIKENEAEIEVSQHRVFLLGENRWEEPSRLVGKNKKNVGATKCLSCHGEGRLMCIECDGTGEPNIEPQFLEWVDEGAKCPYCDGQGYTICDVCQGKTIV
ncbi:protein disulfide isomerase pTAC5, chloroplastic-like [Aristolochia californica]|uniref:protein disulfide isomerase pTAC5, chloroplastic-like n=1 Tax=Aristolochia californica TaxID=171875 RepID=UPI0035D9660B